MARGWRTSHSTTTFDDEAMTTPRAPMPINAAA